MNWPRYNDNMAGRDEWVGSLINNYIEQLKMDDTKGVLREKLSVAAEQVAEKLVER